MERKEQFAEIKLTDVIQHTEPDIRFYEKDGKYYPSATTYLEMLPKDTFLEQWKDKNGAEAVNQLLYKASISGTKVHNAIEELCIEYQENGSASLEWFDVFGVKKYTVEEWVGILKFCDFFKTHVEEVLLTESKLVSERLFVSGTVDNVFRLKDNRIALVDHKFANNMNDKYPVQTWIYKECFEDTYDVKIDLRANLWLKAKTRGADKTKKKIQGKGWALVEHNDDERDSKMFHHAQGLFLDKWRGKEIKPSHKVYDTIALL